MTDGRCWLVDCITIVRMLSFVNDRCCWCRCRCCRYCCCCCWCSEQQIAAIKQSHAGATAMASVVAAISINLTNYLRAPRQFSAPPSSSTTSSFSSSNYCWALIKTWSPAQCVASQIAASNSCCSEFSDSKLQSCVCVCIYVCLLKSIFLYGIIWYQIAAKLLVKWFCPRVFKIFIFKLK